MGGMDTFAREEMLSESTTSPNSNIYQNRYWAESLNIVEKKVFLDLPCNMSESFDIDCRKDLG